MPSIWARLTARGRLVAIAGLVLAAAGVALRLPALLRLGATLVTLVVVALVLVRLSRPGRAVERRIRPELVTVGDAAGVEVHVGPGRFVPGVITLYEEDRDAALGPGPRFRLHGAPGSLTYALSASRRGRFTVGPLAADVRDIFGLARMDYVDSGTSVLCVAPALTDVDPAVFRGPGLRSGGDATTRLGVAGDDDVLVREYRPGDSMRRVHWRSTARVGDLMVRREEQTWEQTAAVVLDNRSQPHAGDGPDDSLEWVVAAAGSIAATLLRAGLRAEVIDADAASVSLAGARDGAMPLDLPAYLASVRPSSSGGIVAAAHALESSGSRIVVALLAQCSAVDAVVLREALGPRRRGLALVVDTETFGTPHGRRDTTGLDVLRAAGWFVTEVHRGDDIGAVLARGEERHE